MKSVEKAGIRGVRRKRNPMDITPESFFTDAELLREQFAKLINASDPKRIAIIPSASYGISTVAKNVDIRKDQHIIVAAEQFPSNFYPWQALCEERGAEIKAIAPEPGLTGRGKKWNEKILNAINAQTKLVALAHTHWADGTKFDLEAIRKRTTEVGALLVIDGTQSVGALPFDVEKIKPDALICAGYKWLLGPYGIGLAYYGENFNNGKPLEENWISRLNSEDFSKLISYEKNYQPGALRYDVGERSNFILVPMMIKALSQLNRWHVENIQEYCASITAKAIDRLKEKDFWVEDEQYRGAHLIGVRIPKEMDIEKLKQTLLKNKVYVSFRGDAIRVAPNVYNDESDLKKLVKVLTAQTK
ncbi:aminotransferase class V-fold PLP-dependent enzyme [Chryseosolibacter indicus]|nr:aminotransferase class V-fold PLP-dependent enzyme [Chryseosolibacter indicus]